MAGILEERCGRSARYVGWLLGAVWLASAGSIALGQTPDSRPATTDTPQSQEGGQRWVVETREIDESSGLAVTGGRSPVFWTHNDSGDEARLFRLRPEGGGLVAEVWALEGAEAVDWEDMAAFHHHNQEWLVVGDVGDNAARRDTVALYFLRAPTEASLSQEKQVAAGAKRVRFAYADGPRDCEAVLVDAAEEQVILIAKGRLPLAGVYVLDIPAEVWTEGEGEVANVAPLTARRAGMLPMPMITAADLRGDGRQLAVATYLDLFLFEREPGEDWSRTLGRTPRHVALPRLKQIEALAYDASGRLWVTSEGRPMPLVEVLVSEEAER